MEKGNDDMTPRVSVIMAVYNTELYLRQCIESVISQSYDDWELIIIDDGSTDSSKDICDEWAANDTRISVVHKQNSGQAHSRNMAISMAKGEYIMFLDSDDWIEPNTLEYLFREQENAKADIVVCSYLEEYTDKAIHIHNPYTGLFQRKEAIDIYYKCKNPTTFTIWGMIIKREFLNIEIPYLRYCEDTAVVFQWVSQARNIVITDKPLYHYRMRKGSVMHIEKEAERAMANLRVIEIRNQYANSHELLAKNDIDGYDSQSYLHVAKQFARECPSARQRNEIALAASKLLNKLMPLDDSKMKKRIRNRLQLLAKHPIRFAWQMYISGLFSFDNKKHHVDTYHMFS